MNVPSSPSAPPPHYAAATSSSGSTTIESELDTFFDIVPQADETSFQVGYLGLEGFRAWIKGDVLIKLDGRRNLSSATYWQCSISLYAIESDQEQSITIFSETQILWSKNSKSSSSSSSSAVTATTSSSYSLPSTLPFSFCLTNDLPHCIHLPSSSLEYRLEATLRSSDTSANPDAFRTTRVHLTRYSRPGPLQDLGNESDELSPYTWNVDQPCKMMIQLERSLFRRADPITVFIRIPPPEHKVLSLSLRSVEANLLRITTEKGKNTKHELLLAHSGKLCRFNSMRAVILRLQLHPPFAMSNMPYPHPDHDTAQGGPIYGRGGGGGCESITQETLLHDVRFFVRISIALRSNEGERHDITLEREIKILPGAAGNEDINSGEIQVRAVEKKNEKSVNGKKGEWLGQSSSLAGPSTSTSSQALVVHDSEEEYDGYEDVGRSLSDNEDDEGSHHLIDEDGPPPTLLESQHDLQVEVEVEGVGAGVLRHMDNVDTSSLPGEYVWRSDEIASHPPLGDEDLPPPPPLTPPPNIASNGEGGVVPLNAVPDQRHSSNSGSIHFPPPYMLASANTTQISEPTDQSILHSQTLLAATTPRIAREETLLGEGINSLPSPPPLPAEEGFPPAYTQPSMSPSFASSQHPPSYEA